MANMPGAVESNGFDPYRVPRLYVLDWDEDEFARQVRRST
jgi:hypothetical protein